MSGESPLVLVVEDEPDLADLYAAWLGDEYRVQTAYGGREALDSLDEEIDIILLDRRMPGLSGDDVLVTIRERDINCRVAMVTAVEPDFDIIAMGFDDYLVKPVSRDGLRDTTQNLLRTSEYDSNVQEFYALASKKGLLESEKGRAALEKNAEYQDLSDRLEELRTVLDNAMDSFDENDEFENLFRGFEDDQQENFGFDFTGDT